MIWDCLFDQIMGKMGCCKLKDRMFELFVQSEAEQEGNLSKDFKNRRDWSVVSKKSKTCRMTIYLKKEKEKKGCVK